MPRLHRGDRGSIPLLPSFYKKILRFLGLWFLVSKLVEWASGGQGVRLQMALFHFRILTVGK